MKRTTTRVLSLLLTLCLIVGLLPIMAFAESEPQDVQQLEQKAEPQEGDTPVVCAELEGCVDGAHGEGCPLYVAPKLPDDAPEAPSQPSAVEEVAKLIAALPDYAEVDETNLSSIYAAQSAYEALSDEEKAAVDADLVAKLEDLAELAAEIEEILKAQAEQGEIEGTVYLADRGETVEVTVAETGTLQALVASTEGYAQEKVVSLTISTEPGAFLNYADFTYLRTQLPKLTCLDISEADCLNDYDATNPVEHEIPRSAMSFNTTLETIVLSEKVTSIAREAFSYCSGLRGDLVIPDNITHLGKAAFGFWGNTYATFDSLTLSKNMEVMEAGAFLRCKINGIVTIPASVTYMGGDGTFGGVFQENRLPGIVFEEGSRLEYIGAICFSGNPNMEGTLTLPDSVTYIGSMAFSGCAKLTGELKLPAKLETLGSNSFYGCTGLTGTVTIPGTVQTVGGAAFASCTGLTGIVLEEGVTEIGRTAFDRCTGVASVILPEGLVSIGNNAFYSCTGLSGELKLPDSLQTIGNSAFQNCTGTFQLKLGAGLTSVGASAFQGDSRMTGELDFPETMETIGSNAFYGCSSVTGLTLPKHLETLGSSAFNACSQMACENLTIPDGISTVSVSAFQNCNQLTGTLTIPDSVTEIGNNAFYATQFQSVVFGENVKTIGISVFQNNTSLTSINGLPDGLESLGANAFYLCRALAGEILLPAGLQSIGTNCFQGTQISKIEYHGGSITEIKDAFFSANLPALQTLDFSGSGIEKLAYSSTAPKLTEVKLPSALKELTLTRKYALEDIDLTGCTDLKTVDLRSNAIDFSAGKPKEWLDSYIGTKTITGQNIILHATRGQTERRIELNGTFEDDFTIKTKNGTDLSTAQAWSEFRSTHQANMDTAKNWVTANRLSTNFPITRTPNYTTGVSTDTVGVQTITYSYGYSASYPELYEKLNYQVTLTVGEGGAYTPEDSDKLTVVQANGSAIADATGLTKTYMDLPFGLKAKIGQTIVGLNNVTWTVYADENGGKGESTSDAVLKYNEQSGMFEITGAGTAWITATYGSSLTSSPIKVVVKPREYSVNLEQTKSKVYGAADPANFFYGLTVSANGKTEELEGVTFTRDAGEDVGTYQVYLYDPDKLSLSTTTRNTADFWNAYAAAAKAKFAQDNPNFTLTFGANDTYLPSADSVGNFTITARALGQNVRLNVKNYDTTTDAQINTTTPVTNILPADLDSGVSVQIDARFDSADVKRNDAGAVIAQDGEVTVTLTGAKVKNYALPSGYASGQAKDGVTWTKSGEGDDTTITMKRDNLSAIINPLTVSCYVQPLDKVYDGTTAASFESPEMFRRSFIGLAAKDQEKIGSITAEFLDKNAGNKKEVVLHSEEIVLSNYKLPTFSANITPAPLTVTGLSAEDKIYDGTVDAVLTGTPSISLDSKVNGDDVSIAEDGELKGQFYDKHVGNKKTVVVAAGFGLTGADAGNYYLQPASTVYAKITPATLTITPDADQNKIFGENDPAFTYTLDGLVQSDKKDDGTPVNGLLRGKLSRVAGEACGEYAFTLDTLGESGNYNMVLPEDAPKFVIYSSGAALKSIHVSSGTLTPVFNPEVENYTVKLPKGTTTVPVITAEAADSAAHVQITDADSLSGETIITVTAADGTTVKIYTIRFAVAEEVSVTAVVINASSGRSDGRIIATGIGGSGSYEFSLDNNTWQGNNTFDGLAAGSYTLYVRDAEDHSNTASTEVTVNEKSSGGGYIPTPRPPVLPTKPEKDLPFRDVRESDWYYGAVEYVYDEGLMNGTSATKFSPMGNTTRGMIVTILYRQSGSPKVVSDKATWWSDARVWAMEEGISDGTNMNGKITREQLAAMLYRYAKAIGADTSARGSLNRFSDSAKISGWAFDAMQWATGEGILSGRPNGTLDPKGLATRAEVAAMFMRFDKTIG